MNLLNLLCDVLIWYGFFELGVKTYDEDCSCHLYNNLSLGM